jgi:hypothetical protein
MKSVTTAANPTDTVEILISQPIRVSVKAAAAVTTASQVMKPSRLFSPLLLTVRPSLWLRTSSFIKDVYPFLKGELHLVP